MAQTRDRIGDVVAGRYELLDVVGRGGQGLVYKGFDRWMGRAVAVKLLSSAAAREPQMAARLMREQQALSALKGTAAVELFDVCRGDDGEICLVMELLSGIDLEDHLYTLEEKGEHMELYRVVEIFDPIVETLEVAHAAGILHRDLKPANVFLLDWGGVRLLDFGLARLRSATPLTAAGTVMGSPSYIAPETWAGRTELVDHRADVYSLGVILFRVLSGELPFSGESLQDKFRASTHNARPSLYAKRPELPSDADLWVNQALAIDRQERFQNVRALWNAFLATFELKAPARKQRKKGLWSAAKAAMHRIAGDEPDASAQANELAFVSEALAKSVAPVVDVAPVPPPAPRRKPPPPPMAKVSLRETTLELSENDLQPAPPPLRHRLAEKTVELSDVDLDYGEDSIQTISTPTLESPGVTPPSDVTPSTDEAKVSSDDPEKKARAQKRNKRKRRRRRKA